MNEVNNVNGTQQAAPRLRLRLPAREEVRIQAGKAPTDRVEISDLARFMGQLHGASMIRHGLVERIRAEIEAGTYETPERINATVDILIEELGY
ncbi:MAG: flagellar biosynthesis anti-sigma factor FlgM [Phycisphaerales bacterium]|nr:MAG: flagellar biosynthesis anti-sigma factor FlgM [Phycisphaerales bacterium]